MIMPDPYTITATLQEDATVGLYRGVRRQDGAPVIIKALHSESPAPREVERLRREYELGRRLDSPYLLKPVELETPKARLILEDFDGEPLSGQLDRPLEPGRFLDITLHLAAALADIHRQGIVHKNLKPANILIRQSTGQVKLIDLGLAVPLTHVAIVAPNSSLIEGTLAYMSPEQTGRMNRGVDHRSDLYSLGVTFYEMLTGELPFHAADPLEWVHCHIARLPREVTPAIPETLADIVLKLLAKQAEERYQSAQGLQADLQRCREQWAAGGEIAPFSPGQQDVSDRFLISPRLYGREKEAAALVETFNRVRTTGQAGFMFISGYSGIGKSALVRELQRPVVQARGYFITGKFDQYQRDIPYATLMRAFHDLVQQILTESDERIQHWKADLQAALGANGRLIVDIIPHLELIIGPQPPVPELPPTEAQRRFHLVFHRFVGVFAQKEHPLVLFLDDLQWLDPASLKLMTYLMTHPDLGALLLIGAYRDNEVGPSHPLMRTLAEARQSDVVLQELVLGPLSPAHLQQWVADTLHRPLKAAAPLARLVYDKTAGNPFFAIQFLTTLYQEGLLAYDQQARRWQWDLAAIRKQDFTDNVVELMLGKLKRFSATTQKALMLAACIGHTAEVRTLALLCGWPEEQIHLTLREATDEGLLWRLNGSYKFLHDRVQEAAYALIPVGERPAQHLRIGRLILGHTPEEQLSERIFEIVGHLNRGAALIASQAEREDLAALNLTAGKRAKASTAYAAALIYFAAGADLLAEDCWERRHGLAYSLEINRAECEFLTGDRESAEQRLTVILEHAADTVEQAAVACLCIDLYTTLGQSNRAIAAGLDFLQRLGINCHPHPSKEEVRCEYERIKETFNSHPIEELLDRPLMSHPAPLATVEVMTKTWPPALFTDANLASLIICKAVSLSLEWGHCDASCFAYALLGRIAGPSFGDYQDGFRFGQLGYELVERRGLKRFEARTYLCFSNSIMPWMKHVQDCHDLQGRAFEAANRAGDLLYEAFACNSLNTDLLFAGKPLPQVQGEVEQRLAFAEKARFGLVIDSIVAQLALIRTLRGLTLKFGSFDDGQFNELRLESHFSGNPALAIAACRYWVRKLQARYIAGDYATAIDAESKAQQLLWTAPLAFEEADYHFYGALVQAAYCDRAPDDQRQQHFEALTAHHRQLEIWAENCPANFENRAALVGAEIARLENRVLDAERLYEKAIASARENGFVHNEAVAYEVAADFYRQRGFEKFARTYLAEAAACYARWGADGKLRQMEQRYPQLRESPPLAPTVTFTAQAEQLDLLAVIKASQAISGEILLSNLQETLMRLVLEHAGAQRGCLLLAKGESLTLHAQAEFAGEKTQVEIVPALPLSAATLPLSLLTYVRRTGETVVLDDAAAEGPYVTDEYITCRKPRSVLALPITRQARLMGILYLENNLIAGAFTPQKLTVLELLAAQAAVSLETARLYANLQQENAERRRAEDALRRLNRELHAISNCNQVVVRAEDEQSLLNEICRIICDEAGYRLAWVGYAEHDDARTVRPVAWGGFDDEYVANAKLSWADNMERGRGPGGTAIRSGVTVCIQDFTADPRMAPWRESALPRGYRSAIALPLKGENANVFGVLLIYSTESNAFTPDEIRLMEELAGDLAFGIIVLRTRTERKNAEAEIRTLNQELEQRVLDRTAQLEAANKELEAFAYSVSHDLRAPLRHIDGFLEMLQQRIDETLDDRSRHYMTTIADSARRMGQLIDNLLAFSRMGRNEMSKTPVDLGVLVQEIIREFTPETQGRSIHWRITPLPTVSGDRAMLRQVLVNLLANALKFTRGRPQADIEIGCQAGEKETVIFIRDDGVGFEMAYADKLFGVFQRLHRADEFEGTGIGLANVRRIIQRHGGRTWAEGQVNQGAVFYFSLPQKSGCR